MAESEGSSKTASVRIVTVPRTQMPDGCLVVAIESKGALTWAVCEDDITGALRDEFNAQLQHVTHDGLWHQNWPETGKEETPGHPH
ncbi:hypothetical protein ACGFZH_28035 [Streptomyces zaomyceticus]|uniref:hypothetical protein n=1 Tax=Streptomyces zaomyceticus TaxID=68286 RepID=UPI003716A7ED